MDYFFVLSLSLTCNNSPAVALYNGYTIYVDIMTGENCLQFRLLTLIYFIGQFFLSISSEGYGVKWVDIGYRFFSQLQVSLY